MSRQLLESHWGRCISEGTSAVNKYMIIFLVSKIHESIDTVSVNGV